MRDKASAPETIAGVLLVLLVAGGVAFGGGGGSGSGADPATAGARAAAARVAPIARRVETIRGLPFKKLPQPQIVSPAQARRDALADVDRHKPAEIQASARVGELLGLLRPGTDLRAVEAGLFDQQVLGYYDPHRKRLAIVAGALASDNAGSEITLAHELDHADDDQHFGLDRKTPGTTDDASLAFSALVEGTATAVMTDYARRYLSAGDTLKSALSSLGAGGSGTDSIPPYILNSLLFTYLSGQQFVDRLREVAGDWKLVNYAFSKRAPLSTEQVIHPEKYLVNERPLAVRLDVKPLLPRGWRRQVDGTFGEFDTDQLLKLVGGAGDVEAGDAAAGWGGGVYELWSGPGLNGCVDPCRKENALVVSWKWDTAQDAAEFDRALRSYVVKGMSGRPSGAGWKVSDGGAAVSARGLATTLALAPSVADAERLASGALRR
jgi:hypothetical protein